MKKKLPKKLQEIQDEKQSIIGKRITELSAGEMTIEDLAEKLELSSAMIKKYRSGESAPAIGTLFRLAEDDIFDCDVDYLIGLLPEGQKTHVSKRLNELTGLDSEACAIIDTQLKKHSLTLLPVLNWLIKNGFITSVCHAISNYRIDLMNCVSHKPNISNDIQSFAENSFNEIDPQPEDNESDTGLSYYHQLVLNLSNVSPEKLQKWQSYNLDCKIPEYTVFEKYEDITPLEQYNFSLQSQIEEYSGDVTDDKIIRLGAAVFLHTFPYFRDKIYVEMDREMIIPHRFNRLIDKYYDEIVKEGDDK